MSRLCYEQDVCPSIWPSVRLTASVTLVDHIHTAPTNYKTMEIADRLR